jgi:hypothetical protein
MMNLAPPNMPPKYTSYNKLNAGVATFMNCITSIFGSKERSKQENKALLKESKMLELMSHLLNHE